MKLLTYFKAQELAKQRMDRLDMLYQSLSYVGDRGYDRYYHLRSGLIRRMERLERELEPPSEPSPYDIRGMAKVLKQDKGD